MDINLFIDAFSIMTVYHIVYIIVTLMTFCGGICTVYGDTVCVPLISMHAADRHSE